MSVKKGRKHDGHDSDSESDKEGKGGAAYKKTTQTGAITGKLGAAAGKKETMAAGECYPQ